MAPAGQDSPAQPAPPPVRVLVLGGDEGPAEGLVAALGAQRAAAVRALLRERALAWARSEFGEEAVRVVPESSFAAVLEVGDATGGPGDATGGPGDAAGGPGDATGGPGESSAVVAVLPELPVWHPELAGAALSDLRAGCALSLAPIFDRGLYLLALADASADRAAALAALDLAGPGGMAELISLAEREGWDVGLLRAERGLRRARDVQALLADPLTDPELRALLQ